MSFLKRLLENHVLANATFVVILVVGTFQYFQLPRSQDPEINFNWINIITVLPGASAEDVERLITEQLEESIQQVADVKFVSSTSRESVSNILVRFNDISERTFDKRVNDLRREIQNKANAELPDEAEDPQIMEITTSNSYPSASLILTGKASDETLRKVAQGVKNDIERLKGVDKVKAAALFSPELTVAFSPDQLQSKGITPAQLADSVSAHFRDTAAGDLKIGHQQWLVRVIGTNENPDYLGKLPIIGALGDIPIDSVANVSRSREKPAQLVSFKGKPAVMLAITKQANVNTLKLIERINTYIIKKNEIIEQFGIEIKLLDDQSTMTKNAIDVMQQNALLGLLMVIFVTWLFLGGHIAFFIGVGIPFTLAGTFWFLSGWGETLNQSVLLGVVIVLGMLVDDAVVVVESIYYRIQRGAQAMQAALAGLREVFSPVSSSVLTTMAAFLPLMLLPGILGDFMFVIPFVVTVALAISLVEAYWILPVHIAMVNLNLEKPSNFQTRRIRYTKKLRLKYGQLLIKVLRSPKRSAMIIVLLVTLAASAFAAGLVRVQFFAFDPIPLFYVNVEMTPGASLEDTLKTVEEIERKVRSHLRPGEARGIASVSGQMFTEMAPFFGDHYGQLTVSLNPRKENMRTMMEIVDSVRSDVLNTLGPENISFLIMEGGPPKGKPISVKVQGNNYAEIESAVFDLRQILSNIPSISDISDDNSPGKPELQLKFDNDAVRKAGLNPAELSRMIRLMFDGEVVANMQHEGEQLDVRVLAMPNDFNDINRVLEQRIALSDGDSITLGQLTIQEIGLGRGNIRHYDFHRTITVEASIDKTIINTVSANKIVTDEWQKIRLKHPNVNLNFSGELDDIQESLDSMLMLGFLGVSLIYLILGTQFKSYWQPFMILITVPLALTGVIFGLIVSNNPMSLFTLYGVVALIGIAVNSAIVMIHAANQRMSEGMSVLHATIYAARRRVVPIVITSLTTIAGLFSLAIGLGGHSLLWGPVASAIVWGLAFSTTLTLFVVPMLYQFFMRPKHSKNS